MPPKKKVSNCIYQKDLTALEKQSPMLKVLKLKINIKSTSFNEVIEALKGFPNHNIDTLALHIIEAPIWQEESTWRGNTWIESTGNLYAELFQLLPRLTTLRIDFQNDIGEVDDCLNTYLKNLLAIKVTIKREYALCLMPADGEVQLEEGKLYVEIQEGVGLVYTGITLKKQLARNIPLVGLAVPSVPLTIEALMPLKDEILRIASENGDIAQDMEVKNTRIEIDMQHYAYVLPWVDRLLSAGVLDDIRELKLLGFNSPEKTSLIEYDLRLMPDDITPGAIREGTLYMGVKEGELVYTVMTPQGTLAQDVPLHTTTAVPFLPLTIEKLTPLKDEILRIALENGHIPTRMTGLRHCIERNQIKNLSLFDGIDNGNDWENNHGFLKLFAGNTSLKKLNLRFRENMLPNSFAILLENKSIRWLGLNRVQYTPKIEDYLSKNFSVTDGEIGFVNQNGPAVSYMTGSSNLKSVGDWYKKNQNYQRIFNACFRNIRNFINQENIKDIYNEGDFYQTDSELYSNPMEPLKIKLSSYTDSVDSLIKAGFSTVEHNMELLRTLLVDAWNVYGVVHHLFKNRLIEALQSYLSLPIGSPYREVVGPKMAHQLFMLDSEYIRCNISLVEFYRNLILLLNSVLINNQALEDLIVRILNNYYTALAAPDLKVLPCQPKSSFEDLTKKKTAISYSLLLRIALEANNLPDDLKASLDIAAKSGLYNQSLATRLLEEVEVREITKEKFEFLLEDSVIFESLVLSGVCTEVDLAKLKDEFIKRLLKTLLEERAAKQAIMSPQDRCQLLLDGMHQFEVEVTKRLDSYTKRVGEVTECLGLFAKSSSKKRKASCLEEKDVQDREEDVQANKASLGL